MGSTQSVNIDVSPKLNYFALDFDRTDRLRLVAAQVEVLNLTKRLISSFWTIQDIHELPGFIEFKLKGTPFSPSKKEDIDMKYFICVLLKEYYAIGWHLKFTTDLRLYGSESKVVIFERASPISTNVICLSLNDGDKLRVFAPDELLPHIRTAIMTFWPRGIQEEKRLDKSFEFKLKGYPWGNWIDDSIDSTYTVSLMSGILSALYYQGWIYTSAIETGNRDSDLNALYFKYDPIETQKLENSRSRFYGVSLNKSDRLRLVYAEPEIVMAVKNIMPQLWPRGIQKENEFNGIYEFKLKGNPWDTTDQEKIDANRFLGQLFSFLSNYNWNLYATCTLTDSLSDKSTFFFRCNQPEKVSPINTLCVSLDNTDKINVIDGSQNIVNTLRNCIITHWVKGIQAESSYQNTWKFKLKGNPFTDDGDQRIYACYLMIMILSEIETQNIRLISSADTSGRVYTRTYTSGEGNDTTTYSESYKEDLDTWFFAVKYRI